MFEPEERAYVYFYQPLITPEVIEEHHCKIGPDVDLLGRINRWLAEDLDGKRFGVFNLFHVDIPNSPGNEIYIGMSGCDKVYMTSWDYNKAQFNSKYLLFRHYSDTITSNTEWRLYFDHVSEEIDLKIKYINSAAFV